MSNEQNAGNDIGKKAVQKERLAAQLRANLRKRKVQTQAKKASDASRDDMEDKC